MALQGERTQSTGTGHAAVLQDLTSSLASTHALPPLLAGVTTYLVQFCWPPPQVRLQVVMGIQGDRAQWTGQWSVVREQGHTLHPLASSLLSWHSWPPLLAGVVMFRLQVCWPPPQGALQLVLGSQGDRMQSTGQPAVLQALMSTILSSHARPPLLAGVTTVRIQVCSPPPQVTLHVVTGLQEDRTQSTGQPAVLQLLTSSLLLANARPPLLAGVMTVRVQVCSPPLQVLLQPVLAVQEDRTQSTGQPAVLQLLTSSLLLAHARPPLLAGVTTYRYQV